jgi:hypothetical protein
MATRLGMLVHICAKHLNELDVKGQGKQDLITSLHDNIKAFQTKLRLRKTKIKSKN